MKEIKDNYKSKVDGHYNIDLKYFIKVLIFFHFWAPQGLFWPLQGLNLKSRAKLTFGIAQ